jgi:hypothetical protein
MHLQSCLSLFPRATATLRALRSGVNVRGRDLHAAVGGCAREFYVMLNGLRWRGFLRCRLLPCADGVMYRHYCLSEEAYSAIGGNDNG